MMNLNLDSPVSSEIKKFWALSINKETPTIAAIFFFYRNKRSTKKYCDKWLRVCVCVCVCVCAHVSVHVFIFFHHAGFF